MPYVCCVPGCSSSNELPSAILHRFPNVKELCNVWLDRIGRTDLKKYKLEELLSKYRVCGKHFSSNNCSSGTKRLHRFILPTLYLPEHIEVTSENTILDPKLFAYLGSQVETVVVDQENTNTLPNALAINVSGSIQHVKMESESVEENNSCRFISLIDHDYTTLREPELDVSHIINPSAEILMALDENLIPEIVMTLDEPPTLNVENNSINIECYNNIASATVVPISAAYISNSCTDVDVSVNDVTTPNVSITSGNNFTNSSVIVSTGCNSIESSNCNYPRNKTISGNTVTVHSGSKITCANTSTTSDYKAIPSYRTASVGTVTSTTGYRSVSISTICSDYRTATSAILGGSINSVTNSYRTASSVTFCSANSNDFPNHTIASNTLSTSSILPDSTSITSGSDCNNTITTTTSAACTVPNTLATITSTINSSTIIASNKNTNKKKLEAKTFHFKKTNNLPLIIKSALRQCNFPKGTRLVRAIDYAEKGKAMYKIELPSEISASASTGVSEETPIEIIAEEVPAVEVNVSSEDNVEREENKLKTEFSNWKKSEQPEKSGADGPILKLQYQRSTKDFPLSSLDNQLLEVFDSGIWCLPNGVLFNPSKIKKTEFFRNLTNAVSQVIKVKNQRKIELQRKRRVISQKKLKERLRHVLLRQLREEHNVIEEELASKYVDTLYHSIRMNSSPAKLLFIQHKLSALKRAGRRYTIQDKIFALKLYGSIGRTQYRNLKTKLPLPARSSMFLFLNKVPFSQGLNRQVFENLKKSTIKLSEQDRYCSLIFDEHVLAEDDKTEFVGQNKWVRPNGDHVLVFMLRGALRNWKQPIAYLLNVGGINNIDLVQLIKETIQLVLEIGLKPVATIFNTKNSFVEAINHLKMETECYCLCNNLENTYFGFLVGNVEIVPILSPFHLLKLTRDTLLSYDIEYIQSGETKVASWEHVLQLYSCDQGTDYLKVCPRLLEQHVIPKKINSATINSCSEIFSQRVSAVMRKLATLSADGIEPKASETADFLLLMDQILDSVNGTTAKPPYGKPYKCVVNANSAHLSFWAETIEIISTWKYLNGEMNYTALTIGDNWIASLLAYVYIVNKLLKEDIKEIPIRNFTNGPLDKFFENLRTTDSQKPKNPTYHSFFTAYRSFVLGNDLLHTCFVKDDTDSEVPLDIIRDYVYDEGAIADDDCPMGNDCCSSKDQETQMAESDI